MMTGNPPWDHMSNKIAVLFHIASAKEPPKVSTHNPTRSPLFSGNHSCFLYPTALIFLPTAARRHQRRRGCVPTRLLHRRPQEPACCSQAAAPRVAAAPLSLPPTGILGAHLKGRLEISVTTFVSSCILLPASWNTVDPHMLLTRCLPT